ALGAVTHDPVRQIDAATGLVPAHREPIVEAGDVPGAIERVGDIDDGLRHATVEVSLDMAGVDRRRETPDVDVPAAALDVHHVACPVEPERRWTDAFDHRHSAYARPHRGHVGCETAHPCFPAQS